MTDKKQNQEVKVIQQQVAELTEALKRERADATNASRRHEQQLAAAGASAKVNVVRQLLPVIDNFERALAHVPKALANDDYVKGVASTVKQFEKTLADLGVEKIKTTSKPFNPELHEAVSMEDAGGKNEIVSEELQSGYKLGDQVIRHAMVRVKLQ
jgi:molecular chaperone GrpE